MTQLANRPIIQKTGLKPRRMKATKAEQERYRKLKEMGCIVTWLYFNKWAPAEIHHLTEGGRRLGNDKTIPLTSWYHRAQVPPDCLTGAQAEVRHGPSLHSKKDFELRFNTEEWLLEQVNKLLEAK